MIELPSVEGLGWSKVRTLARELAARADPDEVSRAASPLLDARQDVKRRMLGGLPAGVYRRRAAGASRRAARARRA